MNEQLTAVPQEIKKDPFRNEWLTIGQFGLSALAIFGLWSSALGLALYGAISFFGAASQQTPLSLTLVAAGAGVSGLLLLPSAFFAFRRLIGRPISKTRLNLSFLRPTIWIFSLPLVLLAGYFVARTPRIAWIALPPLHVLAIGLPVAWLLYLSVRRLPLGSPQRAWGVFGSGLVLGPALILVSEMAALVLSVLLALAVIASQPDMLAQLQNLAEHLRIPGFSPDQALPFFEPFLDRPFVILAILSFGAVIVPLVEEFLNRLGSGCWSAEISLPRQVSPRAH